MWIAGRLLIEFVWEAIVLRLAYLTWRGVRLRRHPTTYNSKLNHLGQQVNTINFSDIPYSFLWVSLCLWCSTAWHTTYKTNMCSDGRDSNLEHRKLWTVNHLFRARATSKPSYIVYHSWESCRTQVKHFRQKIL